MLFDEPTSALDPELVGDVLSVMRLLAKDPADRPPSAGSLARSLDGIVGHTPPDGVPVPDDDEPGTSDARSPGSAAPGPAPAAGGGGAVAAGAAGAAGGP